MDGTFINTLINSKDIYITIKEIYDHHKDHGFVNKEDCLYDIYDIIDIYNIPIDSNKLNTILKINRDIINRDSQQKFRQLVEDKFKKCVISGNDIIECDACHIVPLTDDINNNVDNGILLTKSLHTTFDKYLWSINPDTLEVETNNGYNILINNYVGNKIDKKYVTESFISNLEKHYKIFIDAQMS